MADARRDRARDLRSVRRRTLGDDFSDRFQSDSSHDYDGGSDEHRSRFRTARQQHNIAACEHHDRCPFKLHSADSANLDSLAAAPTGPTVPNARPKHGPPTSSAEN